MCFSMTDPQSLQHLITVHNQDIQDCKYKILVGTHSDDVNNQTILDYLQTHGKEPVSKVELDLAQQALKAVATHKVQADKHFGLNDMFLSILELGKQIVREKSHSTA